jgi:predicted HTH transcriptional regulator
LSEMMSELRSTTKAQSARLIVEDGTDTATEAANPRQIADYAPESLPLANQERQRIAAERQRAIVELLTSGGALTTAEIVSRLRDDFAIETSERTVRSDMAQLAESGAVGKEGKRWWAQAVLTELPTMAAPVLNGTAH